MQCVEGIGTIYLGIFAVTGCTLGPSKKNLNNYYSLGDLTTWS